MKKILLTILIIFVLYILAIFVSPTFAEKIWWLIPPLKIFNENVLKIKNIFDKTVTDLPTKEELNDVYNKTLSWATIVWKKIENWTNKAKEKIDDVRNTLSWAEAKYNEVNQFIDEKEKQIDETKELINKITSTWVTEDN